VKHIYSVDGFTGLFRGYGCAVLAKAVAVYTTAKVDAVKANLSKVDDCCFFSSFRSFSVLLIKAKLTTKQNQPGINVLKK